MSEFFSRSNLFLWASLAFGIFFGLRAKYIFGYKFDRWTWDQWIYQFWFNFLGAFIGWMVAYYLSNIEGLKFDLPHLGGLILAFLGVTGNLPRAVYFGKLPGL